MSKRQIFLTTIISSLFTLAIIASSMLLLDPALAAPPVEAVSAPTQQTVANNIALVSVSALAFGPINQDTPYTKDTGRQLLSLNSQTRNFIADRSIFVAPLLLPDRSRLTGMTVFGEDFDNQGAVLVRLIRCDHGQARCLNLAETTSTASYAAGQFETLKVSMSNEVVDNNFYSYFLELELTAIFNSGLRSVKLEIVDRSGAAVAPRNPERWSLSGSATSFPLPNLDLTQVQICTDDLSHLDNPTHFPMLVVDGELTTLTSNTCVTVWGRDLELRRRLNTGPSSGTYQFLR
jgi:hypothetical protein